MSISGVGQLLSFPALRVVNEIKAIEGVEVRTERAIAECYVAGRGQLLSSSTRNL